MTRPQKLAVAGAVTAGLALAVVAGVHFFTSTPQPPIKIRGGAMTLRYPLINGNDPWFPYQSGGVSGFCTTLDTTSGNVKLKIAQHPDPDPDPNDPDPPNNSTTALTGSWLVDLDARNPDFTRDPTEGLELKPVTDCNGNNNGVSVLPLPKAANSGFYAADLPGDGKTFGKRYQKSNCSDKDACEHLSTIFIKTSSATTSTECGNGDCLVKIVVK
jgi:hypothetical protein